ncbi:hypothetical protein [Acidisphaera sp. L21]|uniref:hypothetical protein n=1 Tax=Acidisphaera sp. L21 TaxID=1641851 RepID=UPI00131C7A64|nr:hypothetical protein [Acidisphaera sp. L21]
MPDINQSLNHRAVHFSITRESLPDEPPVFRWMVHPGDDSAPQPITGAVDGPRAFARAHAAACSAIDTWLDHGSGTP